MRKSRDAEKRQNSKSTDNAQWLETNNKSVRLDPAHKAPGRSVATPAHEPLVVIQEDTELQCSFNVLPKRTVTENFLIKEYRIWDRYIEADFDRSYHSDMLNSPSHVVFLTALVHTQKLMYVYMCNELGIGYDPNDDEKIKFWPSKVDVRMPRLVTEEDSLVHRLQILDLRSYGEGRHKLFINSQINGIITIAGEAPMYEI